VAVLISEAWLKEWTAQAVSADDVAVQLTEAGLEVDDIQAVSALPDSIVIGQVLSAEPHPDADRLRVCQVVVDEDVVEATTIVCGCPSVCAGIKVAVAQVGTVLPGGMSIESRPLRGITSSGMICSESELGLPKTCEGIWILPEDAPLGQPIAVYLGQKDDKILHVDVTPNRGDCLSIRGLAQEIAVLNRTPLNTPIPLDTVNETAALPLEYAAKDGCIVYQAARIEGLDMTAKLPDILAQRLASSGQGSVNSVVDILNYVMFELGQPMHAFDADQVSGSLKVQWGEVGTSLALLDGQMLDVKTDHLLIVDDEKPLALAGIMGGLASSVTDKTQSIILESACFVPTAIAKTCRTTGLNSESSFRFERGVDPGLAGMALRRASALIVEHLGGRWVAFGQLGEVPALKQIKLLIEDIERLLGIRMAEDVITACLDALSCTWSGSIQSGWVVTPPSHRYDLTLTEDLVEELLRLTGINALPAVPQSISCRPIPANQTQQAEQRIRNQLTQLGLTEHVGYSFVSSQQQQCVLGTSSHLVELENPLSLKMDVLRMSCWPGLLEAAQYNVARQRSSIRLFELGACFQLDAEGTVTSHRVVSGLMYGAQAPLQWGLNQTPIDFYDIKGVCEIVFEGVVSCADWQVVPIQPHHPALHPGQSGTVCVEGEQIGTIGMLHPQLMKQFKLPESVGLFEIQLDALLQQTIAQVQPVSKYPGMRRDISFMIDHTVEFGIVFKKIQENKIDNLQKVILFDIYQGETVKQGQKSMTLALWFKAENRTLTDEVVSPQVEQLVQILETSLGVIMREAS
jgi:phenylalanyl-tRNA synthetase beta chain